MHNEELLFLFSRCAIRYRGSVNIKFSPWDGGFAMVVEFNQLVHPQPTDTGKIEDGLPLFITNSPYTAKTKFLPEVHTNQQAEKEPNMILVCPELEKRL